MDRANNLKESIKNNKKVPDYIKDLQSTLLQKIYDSTMQIANNAMGNIELAYLRERQYEKDADREIKRLHKTLGWWRAATWRFVIHHSKTIEEAERKLQVFERACMMEKDAVEAFKEALKEK